MNDDHWLVRTSTNEIFGPMSRDALVSQIREGKLGPQDEVCKANSYWIYLDEADEVKKQLGIEMPRTKKRDDESTETDLQALTQELHIPAGGSTMLSTSAGSGNVDSIEDDGTKVLSGHGAPRSEGKGVRLDRRGYEAHLGQTRPLVLGRVEGPSIWRFVVVGLIVLTGLMVGVVIRYLQLSP